MIHAFVTVVAAGSFSAGARQSRVDKALLSRRVAALEKRLGVRLLQRTTRKMHVTEAGQTLYDEVAQPLDTIVAALQSAAESDELSGRLRMATAPALIQQLAIPTVRRMQEVHPGLVLEIYASEAMVDMVGEGIDVALRMGRMADSSLVARKLGSFGYVLCASPQWVAANPNVESPEAIASRWVLYSEVPQSDLWRFRSTTGELREIRVDPVITVDDGRTQREAVLQGVGVSALLLMAVERELERGDLVRVLPNWRVDSEHGIYVVYPHRTLMPRRVGALIDTVTELVPPLEARWRLKTR